MKEVCPHCNKEYSKKGIGSHIWKTHGNGNRPAWNKGLTKDTNDAVRRNSESLSKYNKANNICPPSRTGKKHTSATKHKIARSMRGNTNSPGRGKISYYGGIKMKSSWEIKVAEYLDECKLIWKYEDIMFPLTDTTSYTPDFFVYDAEDRLLYIIEVKGYFRPENKEKYEQFLEIYPDEIIELWNKNILLEKGII